MITIERSLTLIVLILVGLTAGLIGYTVAYDQQQNKLSVPKSIICTSTSSATPATSSGRTR